jgi:hypothetical protein
VKLAIRPMLDAEVPLVRDTWTRSIDAHEVRSPSGRKEVISGNYRQIGSGQCPWLRVGASDQLVAWAWHDMHRAWVKSLWDDLVVLVATLQGHDEALGWVAFTPAGNYPLVVHYVYTIDLERARRRGVAKTLVRAALAGADSRAPRYSHMTPVGRQIVDAIATDARAPTMRGGVPMH